MFVVRANSAISLRVHEYSVVTVPFLKRILLFPHLKGPGNIPVENEVTIDLFFVTEFYPITTIVYLHVGATLFSKFL